MTDPKQLAKLREPFPPEQIGKLPKGGATLDFVGHGYLTARLLDVDPLWTWEPLAYDSDGLPKFDSQGGLWIKLTVCGVTRLGYGDARGPNAVKECIGDALRNAAMRFGAALDLWCKGDLDAAPPPKRESAADKARAALLKVIKDGQLDAPTVAKRFLADYGVAIGTADAATVEGFTQIIADEIAIDTAAGKDTA